MRILDIYFPIRYPYLFWDGVRFTFIKILLIGYYRLSGSEQVLLPGVSDVNPGI